jgi:P27 family predicted phage terminase small subunit
MNKNKDRVITKETKFGSVKMINPKQTIATESLRRSQSLAAEFGFTPNARMKLKISGKDDGDSFDDFLNG